MTAQFTTEIELPPTHVATLQHIHRDLATTQDSEAFTQRALDALCELIQPAEAYVLLLDRDSTTLSVVAAWPEAPQDQALTIPIHVPQTALLDPREHTALAQQLGT